jgi:hypothetical protein
MQDVNVKLNPLLPQKNSIQNEEDIFTRKLDIVDLNLGKKVVKCYIWSIALYGAEI